MSRRASARLKGKTVNLTVAAVYAPTLDAAEERLLAGYMLIVAGDWNARPVPADPATRHILDKFAVGTRCAMVTVW